jgi:signal transduction histidine kinase
VQQELDRLRIEIEKLRGVGERLVLAADADRRTFERDLHDGVQQHLVALATTLQLARLAADADPMAVETLLDELGRDVRQALDETALLAQRIHPSTLELGGLAALLRWAAQSAGVPATVEAPAGSSYPREVGMTVYLCWIALLRRSSNDSTVAIRVREDEDALTFELVGNAAASDADLHRLQDRVEALGGRLTNEPGPGGGVRVSGLLPLRR